MLVYKGTDKDMRCRGFQYKLGEKAVAEGTIDVCHNGLHACTSPLDVLRYYPINQGNRYFEAEADGTIIAQNNVDSKIASSALTLTGEIGIRGLIKAHFEYIRKKASDSGKSVGYGSNLAGGNRSNLAGGDGSNLAGGYRSNLAGGYRSNLVGGDGSNLAGGDGSNLAGGYGSMIVGRNNCKAKGGKNSVLVLTEWGWVNEKYVPIAVVSGIVDGVKLKADTWYKLLNGEFVEDEANE